MAFIPKAPEGVSFMSKYSEFKPIVSAKTPLSMMQQHPGDVTEKDDHHRNHSRGVIPGYQGHVPRARDTFGVTAVGGLAPDAHIGSHKKMGPMSGHEGKVPWEEGYSYEAETFGQFSEKKRGVMPGYAGFRPGARDVDGPSAFGGIPHDGTSGHGDNDNLKQSWDRGRGGTAYDYRKMVNGILPGYTGHVPLAVEKHGVTHYGAISQAGDRRTTTKEQLYVSDGHDSGDGGTHFGAQRGHTNSLLDKCNDVNMHKKSGYSGHMPNSRDAFGTTVYDGGH